MKLKIALFLVVFFNVFFVGAQISKVIPVPFAPKVIVDPEAIDPSTLVNGFEVVTIDGIKYLKVNQDGWNNWTNIPPTVVHEGATHLKFQAKYEQGSGVPVDRAVTFVKLYNSDWSVVVAEGGNPASTVFQDYQMPVLNSKSAGILQAAVMDNLDWSGVTGAVQYIGKIEAIADGNSVYNLSYESTGSDKTIQIASELNWTISSDQTWLTLSKTSGTGTDFVTLSAATNNTEYTRNATITIHTDGYDDQYINISQYAVIAVTAGELKTILADQLDVVTGFKLTGTIDARDFKTMRDDMPMLADVDLNDVTIVEYTGTEGTLDGENLYLSDAIPSRAFCGLDNLGKPGLKNIILPNNITLIGFAAFKSCTGLTSVLIPNTVTKIDNQAFLSCSGLSNVLFDANSQLNIIGRNSFRSCTSLSSITLPAPLQIIDQVAFGECYNLSEILFESNQNLETIGAFAFSNCSNLTSFSIFQSVTSIGSVAFAGTNAYIHVDEGNPNFTDENGVLYDILKTWLIFCPPSKSGVLDIPNSVTTIVSSAFYNCSGLTSINIPSGLETIGSWAFENCFGLTSLSIPSSVTSIESFAFYNCSNLKVVAAYPTNPVDLSLKEDVFFGIDKTNCILNVPIGSKTAYQAAALWQDFENINELLEITLTGGSITTDNETLQIQAQILPEDAPDKRLIWYLKKTDGSEVKASINSDGLITPLLDEEIIVWATSFDSLAISNEVSVSISGQNLSVQDLNIIKNGDFNLFDAGTGMADFWGGYTDASPAHQIIDGVSVHSPVGAENVWQYQFSQLNLTALPNVDYVFSFKAWADADRTFTVDFEDSQENNFNRYGASTDPRTTDGNGRSDWTFYVTTEPTTYTFDVNFDQITETTVQSVMFMLGTSNIKAYIDDVVLISAADLDLISTSSDHITLKRTPVAPQIDGVADGIWDKISAVPIGKNFLGENPTVNASWKAMYDDNNIYLLINVQDDDHYPAWEAGDGSFWEYDQPEVFFDVNNELLDGIGPSSYGSGHWVFSFPFAQNEYGTPQVNDLAAPVTWCYTLSGENYHVEYAFPFNSLTQNDGTVLDVNGFKALGAFGFDITIDDRDAQKDSRDRKVWQNIGVQNEAYFNMDDCGTISLGDEEIETLLTPWQAASDMTKGINLGNTMEPPTEGGWNNSPAEEYYFDMYADSGFNFVRIPIRWDNYTSQNFPYAIDPDWLNRVEQVVDWGLSRGLYIVINSHHDDWIKKNYSDPDVRERFDSIWSQISVTFKDKSEKLLFEVLNEPQGLTKEENDDLHQRVISVIRKTNPARIIIFQGNNWGSSDDLIQAAIPSDNFVMGSFHSYDPYEFGLLGEGTWGSEEDINNLRNKFLSVKNWSDNNNIPAFMGEFGSLRICDYNSRMKHYKYYTHLAREYGIIPCAWDDGGDFKILERQDRYWDEVKDILIYSSPESPDNINLEIFQDSIVKISWTNVVTDNAGIFIERRKSTDRFYEKIASLSSGTTVYNDIKPEINSTWHYRVVAHYATKEIYSYPQKIFFPDYTQNNLSIGLVGTFNNWGNAGPDIPMVQNSSYPEIWTVFHYFSEAGEVKFRQDEDWAVNWGSSDFPKGFATLNGENIPVPAGNYHIFFFSNSGEYGFEPFYSILTDSIALVAFYNATAGNNWTNNENWLTGPVSSWYGITVENERVVRIDLNNNNLSGTLPDEIGQLTALKDLVLWGNQITGNIPEEIGTMYSLVTFDLGLNNLTGTIPVQFGQLSNLEYLFIGSGSHLTGTIPAQIGNLTKLRIIALDENDLSGTAPEEFGNLHNLNLLFLQGNQLSYLPDLSSLENLSLLDCSNNRLTFSDLEPNVGIPEFYYSPQGTVSYTVGNQNAIEGDYFFCRVEVGGENNQYQWFKDGEMIPLQTNALLNISNVFMADAGNYYCEVTNNVVPGLTLTSMLITLLVEENSDLLTLNFETGWNIFSSTVLPGNSNLMNILQPLITDGKLKKVMNEQGDVIEDWGIYGNWQNNIGDLLRTEGYKINVTEPATLQLSGTAARFPFNIPLSTGWNIISWPSSNEQEGIEVFQSLIDAGKLKKVMDEEGKTIENWGIYGDWRNNIGNFKPGEGYSVNVNTDCILTVNESGTKSEVITSEILTSAHFVPAFRGNGTEHMNIHLVNLAESGIKPGDEIGVFDGNVCVGSAKTGVQFKTISIPLSANDGLEWKNGFTVGNNIEMRLFRNGLEYSVTIQPLNGSSTIFTKGGSLFAQLNITTGTAGIPGTGFSGISCYPNPFSEEVNIEIKLTKDSEIQVEVLNQLGQKVKIISTKQIMLGGLHKLTWNGRNENNSQVSPGIYHLKTEIDNSVIINKVVFSK